jgi:hypothetical protein
LKNIYNVITPYSRWYNLPALTKMLEPQGVQWHIMVDDWMPKMEFSQPWIHCIHGRPPPPRFFIGHWMLNLFLDHQDIHDDEYYVLITDDDFYEPTFFEKLQAYSADAIICSMRRFGDLLVAEPANMRIAHVGLEQLIIKGSLLKQYRINGFYEADGDLIVRIWNDHREKFVFAPEVVCYFNFLPPHGNGRYDQWG